MKRYHSHNEQENLVLVSGGDETAFSSLFERYYPPLYRFLYEHVKDESIAEDLVQDIFTKIWLIRETLPGIKNFRAFLFVMARNYAINNIKLRIRERERVKAWSVIQEFAVHTDTDLYNPDLHMDVIDEAINGLPDQQRKAWTMSRRRNMRYAEISVEMNISIETVKKYIQYANGQLRRIIASKIVLSVISIIFLFKK
ncbi:MAG: RNA polymerase sigma-70 factor [Chitinophagaceae bacterium]|nr:RNA polymerase sigma-70 factor [Chitinophagaceae bacterium]MCW5926443.1 RNA polymerase sigma-70 factor [Chitinophagaceae bacterium]